MNHFKPLPHQQKFLDWNPKKAILNWEMRVGKSLPAALWIDMPCRAGNTYIITKKQNKQDWVKYHTKAQILTKEEFKKAAHTIQHPTAIVVDEAHNFASPLWVKGRSQLAEALYKLVQANPECDVLLLTATPITNNPWSLHTLLCYVGNYIDHKKWRERYFELVKLPFLRFPAWMPRKDWREQMKPVLEKYTDIVSLREVVEYLPPANTRVVKVANKKFKPAQDQVATWVDYHRCEQQGKVAEILELGYKKLIIVAHYTQQIDKLAEKLGEYKPVFILDGRTKDAHETIKQAQEAEECYLIAQAGCGEGWDGYMFGCMVFVSMGHSVVQHTQMIGRQRHPKHLKTTETIYMLGGVWDQRIYTSIMAAKDFNPHNYATTS